MTAKPFFITHKNELDLFTKAIAKAHGKNHPEVFEVQALYQDLQDHLAHEQEITSDLEKLNTITNHFAIPDDVCSTFKKTYQLLQEGYHLNHT